MRLKIKKNLQQNKKDVWNVVYLYEITPILKFGVSKIYFLKKLIMYQFPQKYEAAQLFSTLLRNVF